jgi:hypothetical protein
VDLVIQVDLFAGAISLLIRLFGWLPRRYAKR